MRTDPLELENIAPKNREVVEKMKQPYFQMINRQQKSFGLFVLQEGKKPIVDEGTLEQLKALGYIWRFMWQELMLGN